MSSHNKIRKLIQDKLNAANALGELNLVPIYINYDNEDPLDPEDIGYNPYLVCRLMPADTYSDSLGGDIITSTGVFHIKVKVPSSSSTDDMERITNALFSLFRVNSVLSEKDSSGAVTFSTQLISPFRIYDGKRIDNWWVVPCSFEYRSDTN